MYLHHSKGIALAIHEERGPQMIDFIGNREVARCELQECGGRRATVGNAFKVVIAETRTERRANGFD
jgi:O-acetyl-ADP-ribose deacetylase (regulator of RNase III)